MAVNLFRDKGTSIEKQCFTWREMVQSPISKLDDDAFSRIRVILMNGIEMEANRFGHACSRMNKSLQHPLSRIRRIEQHQSTLLNWLLGADHSPLETTIAFEQVAIEVTATVAQMEPDPYLAQVYRYGLLEDLDHLYRFTALMDRLEGKDANCILQSYTDIIPGRPSAEEHRDPIDDLKKHYEKDRAALSSKLHALTIMAGEQQTHNFYMNIGPQFADPTARQLYAEIASIEEQHVTQYESLIDPSESWPEKWLMHEANEVYNYHSCLESESNPRLRSLWERFLEYELGQLQFAMDIFKKIERRDPAEVLPEKLPAPISYTSQRSFIRHVLAHEFNLKARDERFILGEESPETLNYRQKLNAEGSPSETVTAGYVWHPGTELTTNETIL